MKATFPIESFPFPGAAVYIPATGDASPLPAHAIEAHLRGQQAGHVLMAFQISAPDELHPELWEMHPAGDEMLFMFSGALGVECFDGARRGTAALEAGHALVVPKGVWHRLVLHEPGLLLALLPPQGTQVSHHPEEQT
jgi:mannose-6-phosphate isomerase-like protein (cupin superfamily)